MRKSTSLPFIEYVDSYRSVKGQALSNLISKITKTPEYLEELRLRTKFLEAFYEKISVQQRLYHVWFFVAELERCPYCSDPRRFSTRNVFSIDRYRKAKNYYKTCSSIECEKKYNADKTKEGFLREYGVENISQTPEWHAKVKQTNLERYGVEWRMGTPEFMAETAITNVKKYGSACVLNTPEIKKRMLETRKVNNLEKYGVEHYAQSAESMDKRIGRFFRKKDFIMPSGEVEKVQGYEPFAIRDLLSMGFLESDISVRNKKIELHIGRIWYEVASKKHRYYPDIFIVSQNKVIEIKSLYTKRTAEYVNELKKRAVFEAGFDFEFWVYDRKGNRILSSE